jgi:hypothetical protein
MYLGDKKASFDTNEVKGTTVSIDGEIYNKISNVDGMRPFFMSIVSNSDHWMFISSNGGLSAGRKDSNNALFPYYTDDKITESAEITGSKTIIQVVIKGRTYLWEPFSSKYLGIYKINRNLYKNKFGNKIIFEEANLDLGLLFKYEWCSSSKYGFVKKSTIINTTNNPLQIKVLDGIQNIIPYGVGEDLQAIRSNLVDAYKRSELEEEVGLGIYALSAIIVDKAEPSEALKANIVWSIGVENPTYLLSSLQLDNFRKGREIYQETDVKAEKGAYFTLSNIALNPSSEKKWLLVANVNQSITSITEIKEKIKKESNLITLINENIERGTNKLVSLTGASDGIQLTNDEQINSRHFSNTLFNIMRGGIFDHNYQIEKNDFVKYLEKANKKVLKNQSNIINKLPEVFTLNLLKENIIDINDLDFKRLCFEYMPLKFSRRHGDPSRPWNKFSINTRNEIDDSKILDYEGNWRDIFQNWEALAHSYPEFIESMIHKFLNASTFDGYNPYRVTKDGFDWETIEPDNPWSYIGYWGDHQIIYLLKFLEFIENYYPNKLANYFNSELFVYANVPYKIKSYEEILKNSKDTIEFNGELNQQIEKDKKVIGVDGALLRDNNTNIYKVNLIEKLLATVLAKVSNFIPEGGIWMNTQRPEWNDANNALVGNGVSMVTLYYLRRFLKFFDQVISKSEVSNVKISTELSAFFNGITETLENHKNILNGKVSDKDRKKVLDGLGVAGSKYRLAIYKNGFSSVKNTINKEDLLKFTKITLQYIDHSIEANKRVDNLYHAYNLMTLEGKDEISISYLPEMLEGQVAILSSGYLTPKDSLELLDSLKASALFRPDQYSYILYPNKELPRFSDKNNILETDVKKSPLLTALIENNNVQVIEKDCTGQYHFNGSFNNSNSLKKALNELPDEYKSFIENDSQQVLDIFEKIFNHKAFTGRSGTFFGFEGLGSIYWHMVSKLLLAVQETCLNAIEEKESDVLIGKMFDHYFEIYEGIGVHKSPKLYGAFSTDPYSHTPAGKGAQQPGMTGQVKEDILSRIGELGVFVKDGNIQFNPRLLRGHEFLTESKVFKYFNIDKHLKEIQLEPKSLAFTYCQVPILYKLSSKSGIEVIKTDSTKLSVDNLILDKEVSNQLFNRTGEIEHINVFLKEN